MNLCIDQGNSRTKIGIFDQDKLVHSFSGKSPTTDDYSAIIEEWNIDSCILSSVTGEDAWLGKKLRKNTQNVVELTHNTPIPIKNNYRTPETLGKDRLAAVVGASFLKPDTDLLVIDAGTAITYDFIETGKIYRGGNISPGIDMRLRALHEFTKKLPYAEASADSPLMGEDTKSALVSGALYGIVFEMDGYINTLKAKYPLLSTFLTGGSFFYFYNKLKNPIFAENNLVLIGLNRILQYNV
ncbi:MAG TPA: type III pantothenate kinase [Paludibacter sp.]|nr:type III pantothenate kinase [Paludibacter sp.]